MTKVLIYTPYQRNEITWAAVQMADWFVRCGCQVSIRSPIKIQRGVHPYWDSRVKWAWSTDPNSFLTDNTRFCWFEPDFESFWFIVNSCAKKKQAAGKYKHFLFPSCGKSNSNYENFCFGVNRIVCLSRDMHSYHTVTYPAHKAKTTWANLVSPDSLLVGRRGLLQKDKLQLLLVVDSTCKSILEYVPEILLDKNHKLRLTVLAGNSIPSREWSRLRNTPEMHSDQIREPNLVAF